MMIVVMAALAFTAGCRGTDVGGRDVLSGCRHDRGRVDAMFYLAFCRLLDGVTILGRSRPTGC
jgi:hypothetical protein